MNSLKHFRIYEKYWYDWLEERHTLIWRIDESTLILANYYGIELPVLSVTKDRIIYGNNLVIRKRPKPRTKR